MFIHALLKRKAPARCPALAGQTFEVLDGVMDTSLSGTVTINNDLTYTVTVGGQTQSGQLTPVTEGKEYTYHEDGPPVVDGVLKCVAGKWHFQDNAPGTAIGWLREPLQ